LGAGGAPTTSFRGGAFDGRYVYFVPFASGNASSGRVYRYDTQAADAGGSGGGDSGLAGIATFGSAAAWSTYDTRPANASALGFAGGVYDGQFVYFVPDENLGAGNGGFSGTVARYDTRVAFNAGWTFFDMTGISNSAYGFFGGAFDGRHVYFVPRDKTVATRFDTQADAGPGLGRTSSWSAFDLAPDAGSATLFGGAFDGRFVYFVPSAPASGVVTRYDTQSTFGAACAWSAYDIGKLNPSATSFSGAVFDGKFLYLMPHGNTWVARFEAKTPESMPPLPEFHGSFY
jgi:hypothetical protein